MIEARVQHERRGFALDVSFSSRGPVLGVFGRSGSGKTTLLHSLAGILRADDSRVVVQDTVLADHPGGLWVSPDRRRLALVPQDPLLFPHLSTRANLAYAPGAREELEGAGGRAILDVLRLRPLLERNPGALSGGERQRVAIGRALLSRPRLLLLDEPLSSLDAELGREILALLLEAKRALAVPMLFVTHRTSELLSLADDCIVLEEGRIIAQGPPLSVLQRPRALGLANLSGVDNLLRLRVSEHDEAGGVTLLELGGQALVVPLCANPVGAEVDVGLYAQDLILCTTRPERTSARNALEARVAALDAIGHEVLVGLEVGARRLRVRVTTGAVAELELAVGQELYALVKTTACHLLSGQAG